MQNVLTARARLGESPLWDTDRQLLYWVDMYNHRVHQFDPATGRDRHFDVGSLVSAIALTSGDSLLVALSTGTLPTMTGQLALLDPQNGTLASLCQINFPHSNTRLNDGKCDPQGRFWIGSTSEAPGQAALYRYDPNGSLQIMETGLTISNGLAWSPDGATFYLTDSYTHQIYAYPFDGATGNIGDRRILVDLSDEAVEPDGLTVDQQGNLWSALWDGWCVVQFSASGTEIQRIKLPVQRPTCPIFGGRDLMQLYITSASVGLSQQEIQQGFYAGDLFCLATQLPGLPSSRFDLGTFRNVLASTRDGQTLR